MSNDFFDSNWTEKLTIPIKKVGDKWEFFYGGDVPVKDGAQAEITLNAADITDERFRQRVTQEMCVRILHEDTPLRVVLSDRGRNKRCCKQHGHKSRVKSVGDHWYRTKNANKACITRMTQHTGV